MSKYIIKPTKYGSIRKAERETKMTDKERLIYQHVLAIREILETNPQWSGYLNIAIMDITGSIIIHNQYYDQDKDDPINLYVRANGRQKNEKSDIRQIDP